VVRQSLLKPDFNAIKNDILWLEKPNNHILAIDNDLYPPLLKQTEDPPPLLYVTGDPNTLLQPQLAVVGSRNASPIGLKNTHSFCFDMAQKGITITSGMALGVDGEAHRAALDAGGNTIAVMGTGLDVVYPAKHKTLAHDIASNGALISEFPTGTKPNAHNFPRRNRIICGLSLGTLVIEAGVQSGTLITARQTMEINRPVMAIPGSIHNPLAKGCHHLIKQGAKLIESADEILQELTPLAQSLSLQIQEKLSSLENKTVQTENKSYIKGGENDPLLLLEHIMYDPTPIDEIISNSGLSAQEVASTLLILELEDKIQALPGAQYSRL
jgi:DNA processing protein